MQGVNTAGRTTVKHCLERTHRPDPECTALVHLGRPSLN
jgi:hypothetical protein